MSQIGIGKKVPDFSVAATGGQTISLAAFAGNNIILYFYPRDNTPGCTLQGQDLRDNIAQFNAHNAVVFGVSRDSLKSHEKFKAQQQFPFELLSDEDEKLCTLFDVIKEKNMYGKKVKGIERSTFLIDSSGVLRGEWRKVKVQDHVAMVLEALKTL